MRILIAPDSFKDAMRSRQACEHIASGIRRVSTKAKLDLCPVSDGGEGFAEVIAFGHPRARAQTTKTTDPLSRPINAGWVLSTDENGKPYSAIIELASASGLERLRPQERNPLLTSTHGTGRLIREAVERGVILVTLGIGGSATNDGGCGLVQAMGVEFYDNKGQLITRPVTGGMLADIRRIDVSQAVKTTVTVACDVRNPLTGPNGAAHIYGPQKGADPAMVKALDQGLAHLAKLWRDQLGVDVEQVPGAGAAGGVGGGLVAMLDAEMEPGADVVLDQARFDKRLRYADLVITGEGRLDGQSLQGKAVMAVAKRSQAAGVPCVALVGSVGEGAERCKAHGLTDYHVLGPALTAEESIRRTGELLELRAADLIRSRPS